MFNVWHSDWQSAYETEEEEEATDQIDFQCFEIYIELKVSVMFVCFHGADISPLNTGATQLMRPCQFWEQCSVNVLVIKWKTKQNRLLYVGLKNRLISYSYTDLLSDLFRKFSLFTSWNWAFNHCLVEGNYVIIKWARILSVSAILVPPSTLCTPIDTHLFLFLENLNSLMLFMWH